MKSAPSILVIVLFLSGLPVGAVAGQSQDPAAAAAFREARDLVNAGDWGNAEGRLHRFVSDFGKDREIPAALYWLAFALKQQKKFPATDDVLTQLIDRFPQSPWVADARAMRMEIAPRLKNTQVIEQGVTDANEEIKLAALQSLFEARSERAVAIATSLLKPGSGASRLMREGALELLADSEAVEAVPVLVEVARRDPDRRLRIEAIEALAEIRSESAVAPLKALAVEPGAPEIARAAVEALSELPGGRKILLEIAQSNASGDVRVEAIEALGESEDELAAVDDMVRLLASTKEPGLQEAIINALAEIDAPTAEQALVKLARTGNLEARRNAIEALGERAEDDRGGVSAIASLIAIYDSEKDESLKEEVIDVFRESLDTAALKKLMQIASADASVRLRKAALSAIADSEHPGAVRLLEDILTK
jgi:HEAT repeat protein